MIQIFEGDDPLVLSGVYDVFGWKPGEEARVRKQQARREKARMAQVANITQERAAQRFAQISTLERQLSLKLGEVVAAKAHVKELTEESDGLMARIRTAARDDGELPLFNMDGE